MPEQLKIVIDADVNKGIAGVKEFSKVITTDFTKAISVASVAATKLGAEVGASVQKINASLQSIGAFKINTSELDKLQAKLDSIRVKPIELSVASKNETAQLAELTKKLSGNVVVGVDFDTAVLNSEINNLNRKLQSGIDLTVNTQGARARVAELLAEISKLKEREVLLRADNKPVLNSITEVEGVLKRIQGNIKLSADVTLVNSQLSQVKERFEAIKLQLTTDPSQALSSVDQLISQIDKLSTSKIFLNSDNSEALSDITEIKTALGGIKSEIVISGNLDQAIGKIKSQIESLQAIDLDVNTSDALSKINLVLSEIATIKDKVVVLKGDNSDALNKITQIEGFANEVRASIGGTSKLISGDFVQATEKASSAGFNLSERIAAATTRINASIDKMVDDALGGANRINETFKALKTPNLSFGVLSFDSSKALADVQQFKAELNSIKVNPITVPVNTAAALERLNILEKELLSLEALKVSPDISSTQLGLFEANIKRVKTEIASLRLIIPPVPPNTFKSLNDLERELGELKTKINFSTDIGEIRKLGDEFKRLQTQINNIRVAGGLDNQFNKLSNSSRNAASSLHQLPNASNQATLALSNLGRVVQDAPFGFLGIANNLNPLLESFDRLKQTSGTTGKALKAVAGSLLGAGGLGFAVSIASSLLITFGSRLFGAGKAAKDAARPMNEFAEAVKDAARSFSDSAIKATSLFSALSGGRLNLQERKAALEELKSINLEFFGSLKEEDGIIKGLQVAYDGYIARLREVGKTKAIESQLTKLFDKKLQLELSIDTKFIAQVDPIVQQQIGRLKRELQSLGGAVDTSKEKFDAFNDTQAKRLKLQRDITQLEQGISRQFVGGIPGKVLSEINQLDLRINALSDLLKKEGTFEINVPKPNTKEFDKFQDEIIARAKLAAEAFGQSFVVPDLEITFFKNKDAVFKDAKDFLGNVKSFLEGNISALKVKIPVQTDFEFLPVSDGLPQSVIDNFFKGIGAERKIPIEVIPDITISKQAIDDINKKLDLRKQFSIFGDLGFKEFNKIDFSNITSGIDEATKKLQGMMAVATTLQQSIGQGLTNAFNSVFDAVLEGKSVFKALGSAVKALVADTIKAVAQMFILKLVTNLIFPGAGGAAGLGLGRALSGIGGAANFGQQSGIGNRAFQNVLTINVNGQISGDTIRLAGQRAANSQGRFG